VTFPEQAASVKTSNTENADHPNPESITAPSIPRTRNEPPFGSVSRVAERRKEQVGSTPLLGGEARAALPSEKYCLCCGDS